MKGWLNLVRWRYVLPRLVVITAFALLATLGFEPALRHWLTRGVRGPGGARLSLDATRASLWRGRLELRGLRLETPAAAGDNNAAGEQAAAHASADVVSLDLDLGALARGRLVVDHAEATGLTLRSLPPLSGSAGDNAWLAASWPDAPRVDGGWIADIGQRLAAGAAQELETTRLVASWRRRLPEETRRLEARLASLETELAAAKQLAAETRANPLRNAVRLREGAERLEALRDELSALADEVPRLRALADSEKQAFEKAKNNDLERVRRCLEFAKPSPEALAAALLGPEQAARWLECWEWARWARRHLPTRVEPWEPIRARGEDILPAGGPAAPGVLVRRASLAGTAEAGGQTARFSAELENLCSAPQALGQPLVCRLEFTSPLALRCEAVFDRTGGEPVDHVTLRASSIPLPAAVLGDPAALALRLPPGELETRLTATFRGGQVSAKLLARRRGPGPKPVLGGAWNDPAFAARLEAALGGTGDFSIEARLDGDAERPQLTLRSELGSQVAEALGHALRQEFAFRQDLWTAQLQAAEASGLPALEEWVGGRESELRGWLAENQPVAQQVERALARRLPASAQPRVAEGVKNLLRR